MSEIEELQNRLDSWRKLAHEFDKKRMIAIWNLRRLKFLSSKLASEYRSSIDSGDWGFFSEDSIPELVDLEKFLKTVEEQEHKHFLRCDMRTINAKTDYCSTCGKTLIYP